MRLKKKDNNKKKKEAEKRTDKKEATKLDPVANWMSVANLNLVLDTEIAQSTRLDASCTRTIEAGVWWDGGERGRALSLTRVSNSFHNISLLKRSK